MMTAAARARMGAAEPVFRPQDLPARALSDLGRAATVALYEELALYPKPGLVSLVDTGSHTDMDARTFMRSLFCLRHTFPAMARLGAQAAPFAELERLGIAAETRMLRSTGGINTHRGAIFSLGLLCAAAGQRRQAGAALTPEGLRATLLAQWGEALAARCQISRATNGSRLAAQHGLRSAGQEAALGMPVLFNTGLPALQDALQAGLSPRLAKLHAFFAILSELDDTNLVHRGGLMALRGAQASARAFLAAGSVWHPQAHPRALALHHAFVAERLSPGGSADVLAACCWVHRVCAP